MRPWLIAPAFVLLLAALLTACSRTRNYEHAYFSRQGSSYLVELKGTRRLMAHDPISALLGRTYEETLTMKLPRIEGEIDGTEIPVPPDKLSYTGRVVITSGKMKVDLRYDGSDRAALLWNGNYTLVPQP
jgi:hypothetical protein